MRVLSNQISRIRVRYELWADSYIFENCDIDIWNDVDFQTLNTYYHTKEKFFAVKLE